MKIELNEISKVEYILDSGYVDISKPSNTIRLMARYYHEKKMTKEQIIDIIDKFMTENLPDKYNSVIWEDIVEGIVKKAIKDNKKLTKVEKVEITKEEIECIDTIDNDRWQRLVFTYLVYAKILNQMNPLNNNWINGKYRNDIFAEARLTETGKDQLKIIYSLVHNGILKQSVGVTNNSINVDNVIKDGEIIFVLTDFREIGLQWMKFKGDAKVKLCKECGVHIYQRTNNPKIYCKDCAKKVKNHQNKNYYNLGKTK